MGDFQNNYPLTYISLFSGIGGFELGIETIFPNAKCLGYSEINPHAVQTYKKHFANHPALGDVTKINGKKFRGKIDLLVGGSPCQDFSKLGSGAGLDGEKSSLLFHYLRLLDEIRPKFFILENVKMKKEHEEYVSELVGCTPTLIDSNIISCQRRKRLYWTNFDISKIPFLDVGSSCLEEILLDEKDVQKSGMKYRSLKTDRTKSGKILRDIIKGKSDKYYTVMYDTDTSSPTLITTLGHCFLYVDKDTVRQLHPIEMERLQTFPDNWTEGLTKTKRCEVLGNAVTCDVIALICSMIEF
jgi:DNA (cytosine-5)-methyltransferase 3A